MIYNAIAFGGGGSGNVEVITPTATALSNSSKTITLSGITSKPCGALATVGATQSLAIIKDSNGNDLVNFFGVGTTNYSITAFTYNKSANTLAISSTQSLDNFYTSSYWKVIIEG